MNLTDLINQEILLGQTAPTVTHTTQSNVTWAKAPKIGEEKKFRFLQQKSGSLFEMSHHHYGVKVETRFLRCLGDKCPICAIAKKFPESEELKSTPRYNFLVLEDDLNIKVLASTRAVAEELSRLFKDPDSVNPFHPLEGCTIKMRRDGNRYILTSTKQTPIDANQEKILDVMNSRPDLQKILHLSEKTIAEVNMKAEELRSKFSDAGSVMKNSFNANNDLREVPF
jgi:hypothetical protein